MKITKRKLNQLIESFLLESEKTDPKGKISLEKISDDYDDEITDMGSGFMDAQIFKTTGQRPRHPDADAQAVTDARKGSDGGGFPPTGFGDTKGVNTVVRDYHEPNKKDISAGQEYMMRPDNLGPHEKSVHDLEHTIHSPEIYDEDTDEDTEESPFGTQYSLEDTLEIPDYSDIDFDDVEDYGTFEDDSEEFEDDSEEENEEGFFARIRRFLSGKK